MAEKAMSGMQEFGKPKKKKEKNMKIGGVEL